MLRIFVLFFVSTLLMACSGQRYQFEDYQQLLPRGEISAITDPVYVAAADANIADESYVLGVVVAGQSRAYSLNILNNHEVVNDQIGDLAYAAVW